MATNSDNDKKGLKLNIQNKQIAKAVNLKGIKDKLSKKKVSEASDTPKSGHEEEHDEETPRIKARSKSAFAKDQEELSPPPVKESHVEEPIVEEEVPPIVVEEPAIEVQEPVQETPQIKDLPKPPAAAKTNPEPIPERRERLGPTGRHINDLVPPPRPARPAESPTTRAAPSSAPRPPRTDQPPSDKVDDRRKEVGKKAASKGTKFREFRDMKARTFDNRGKAPTPGDDSFSRFRRRKQKQSKDMNEELTIRPTSLKVRLPITVKDLASEMKLKASQLIAQLLKDGLMMTINDGLDDETMVQLLGQALGCEIVIDTSEEERIRITGKSIEEEIEAQDPEALQIRAPVVTFMGHVDHGKTSLIDWIRSSNVAAGEAGAITQHIGAFKCRTAVGEIAILDTPGHEAFSSMRTRGANVTDIVVLVVAGDEGFKRQTEEALSQAKEAGVSIVVAINKSDKPGFSADKVYRELSEHELLPESWGGQTITINTSAITGVGVDTLLEMLALQAEVLELKANPNFRARGTVLESEMSKGLGSVSTVLIQNGTLRKGDSIVVGPYWGKVKLMRDEHGKLIEAAGPSTPVEIVGLSGIPDAGEEFIVIKDEKEARSIAESREQEIRQRAHQRRSPTLDTMLADAKAAEKKIFNVMLCADVQGSLEALDTALRKIQSDKINLMIVGKDVGEVSESDIQLAAASSATIIGFHTQIESHAEPLLKQLKVDVKLHDIIYHAVDDVKEMMRQTLDKIPVENDRGYADVRQVFRSSHLGNIAGCYVSEGPIMRNYQMRVIRDGQVVWKGPIASIKRVKEDVKEVAKGLECGILLRGFDDFKEGDTLQSYEVTYLEQQL